MKLKWGDFLIFIIIVVVIVTMFIVPTKIKADQSLIAKVYVDTKLIYEINLSDINEEQEYEILDGRVLLLAQQDMIRFVESDCPDLVCVNTGWVKKTSQIAACLPNKVLVKIVGENSDVDVILH